MKLKIYMKSGNIVTQGGVKDYKIYYEGNEVKQLSIDLYWWGRRRLIMSSLDLSQIEAITRHIL